MAERRWGRFHSDEWVDIVRLMEGWQITNCLGDVKD
jgi:hypothetical protein